MAGLSLFQRFTMKPNLCTGRRPMQAVSQEPFLSALCHGYDLQLTMINRQISSKQLETLAFVADAATFRGDQRRWIDRRTNLTTKVFANKYAIESNYVSNVFLGFVDGLREKESFGSMMPV